MEIKNSPCFLVLRCSAILLLCLLSTRPYCQGISVSPSRVFFKGEPGQTVTQQITFRNNSNTTLSFVANIKDWDRDSLGVKRYYPLGGNLRSNGEWLHLSESAIQLMPSETKNVALTLTVPPQRDRQELTNSMLFFTQVKEKQSNLVSKGLGINVLLEIGVQVYHIPTGLLAGDLEFIAFEDSAFLSEHGDGRYVAVKIKNTGQINKDAYVRFELTNMETGQEIPINSIAVAMLPEAEQWVHLDVPADLEGRYLAVAILDAGSQYDLKVAEKEIEY